MFSIRRNRQKAFRGAAISILATLALIIIISPAEAAESATTMGRGSLALIAAFATLLLAIVFEAFRLTYRGQQHKEETVGNRATHEWVSK